VYLSDIRCTILSLHSCSLSVPYQDNGYDCGVFVCRYGFAVYALLLRGHNVTYADIGKRGQPFRKLITESDEFDFNGDDILRIRGDLATLLDKLSDLYKEWKKASDEAEKKAEEEARVKKPAARRLPLQGGDASASSKKDPSVSTADKNMHSGEGETKDVAIKAVAIKAPATLEEHTSKPSPRREPTDTQAKKTVDGEQKASLLVPEHERTDTGSLIHCTTAMEMEATDSDEDVDMTDANVTADARNDEMISDPVIPVKQEEESIDSSPLANGPSNKPSATTSSASDTEAGRVSTKWGDNKQESIDSSPLAKVPSMSVQNGTLEVSPFQPPPESPMGDEQFGMKDDDVAMREANTSQVSAAVSHTMQVDSETNGGARMNNQDIPLKSSGTRYSVAPGQQQQPVASYPFYREETAWREYNPPMPEKGNNIPDAVESKDLKPLPPAPPLPDFPMTGRCTWTFDKKSRVLLGNFIQPDGKVEVTVEDEMFLLHMMERDDVTCISDGLAKGIDPNLYSLETIVNACGDEYFHKFRQFVKEPVLPEKKPKAKDGKKKRSQASSRTKSTKSADPSDEEVQRPPASASESRQEAESEAIDAKQPAQTDGVACRYHEKDQSLSLKIADYAKYVSMRQAALKREETGDYEAGGDEETEFRFRDYEGNEHAIDVRVTVLYMIDFDVVKHLPKLNEALKNDFKLPGCLPGGVHCMMYAVRYG